MTSSIHADASANAPRVSFCLATYHRPQRLGDALKAILAQTYTNFEVIVSDNDPDGSSREVVERIGDARVRYFCNEVNVGMVNNFNRALSRATGEYVVMITDDDPPYASMLEELLQVADAYPGYGAYYGACEVLMENEAVARTLGHKRGRKSFVHHGALGHVRAFKSADFLAAFFRRDIFKYMLWSTGIVKREIALRIGGMPDYGSPFLTDFAYMALAGEQQGFVAINKVFGYQIVHGQNSGFAQPHVLRQALAGCHDYLSARLSTRKDWGRVRPQMENYLAVFIVGQLVAMRRYSNESPTRSRDAEAESFVSFADIPYVRRLRLRYWGLLLLYSNPPVQSLYRIAKRIQFGVARLWFKAS